MQMLQVSQESKVRLRKHVMHVHLRHVPQRRQIVNLLLLLHGVMRLPLLTSLVTAHSPSPPPPPPPPGHTTCSRLRRSIDLLLLIPCHLLTSDRINVDPVAPLSIEGERLRRVNRTPIGLALPRGALGLAGGEPCRR